MPVTVEPLDTYKERLRNAVRAELSPELNPNLERSYVGALTNSVAGVTALLVQTIANVDVAAFPSSAQGDYLDGWASGFGVPRQAASLAQLRVTIRPTSTGSFRAAQPLVFSFRNLRFTYVGDLTAGIEATIDLLAAQSGRTTISVGNELTSASGTATVTVVTQGVGLESDLALRRRFLLVLGHRAAGGTAQDWEGWAREITDVTRVFVTSQGAGKVTVYPVNDDLISENIGSLTNNADIEAFRTRVSNHLARFRPAAVQLTVSTPAYTFVDVNVSGVDSASQAAASAVMEMAVEQHGALGQDFEVNRLRTALASLPSPNDAQLVSPTGNVTVPAGSIPVLRNKVYS